MWGNIEDCMNYKGAKRQQQWMLYVIWEKKTQENRKQTNKQTTKINGMHSPFLF